MYSPGLVADAIVVLAWVTGKAYPPQPVPHLGTGADRLTYAAVLYNQNKATLVIFSGNDAVSADIAEIMGMMGIPRIVMLGENANLKHVRWHSRFETHSNVS